MTNKQPGRGKRLFLINRDFQLRYTRLAVLVGAGSTLLTIVLILYPLFQFQILRFPDFLPTPFLIGIGFASLLNFLLVASMGILITHRIAGPMFSVVRHIRRMQLGYLPGELKLREGDDLKYLVRNFNELIAYFARTTAEDLDILDRATASHRAGNAQEASQITDELRLRMSNRLEPVPPNIEDIA